MIKSLRDKRTAQFAAGKRVKQFEDFAPQAQRRLRILNDAGCSEDLIMLPSDHFEASAGDRSGQSASGPTISGGAVFSTSEGTPLISKSPTTTEAGEPRLRLPPNHPGEILAGELVETGSSSEAVAEALGVPPERISEILIGKRSITADIALTLSRYFGTSAEFWLKHQMSYDLAVAERDHEDGDLESRAEPRSLRKGVEGSANTSSHHLSHLHE